MDEERRKKLEGRLKKCLALSNSPEPHEAAAALRPWMKSDGGKRQAFHMGWLRSVREKVEAIAPTEAEEKAIQRYCDKLYKGGLVTQEAHKRKQLDVGAYLAGVAAASDFSLHRPVEEQQMALEHKA